MQSLPTNLKHGVLTPAPIREYNGLRGEDRDPFNGQWASAANPIVFPLADWAARAPESGNPQNSRGLPLVCNTPVLQNNTLRPLGDERQEDVQHFSTTRLHSAGVSWC